MTQLLNTLKLEETVLKKLEDLGDPITSQLVTERKLRSRAKFPIVEQINFLKELLNRP